MFNSGVLDVAVGLIFVYFLLSITSSAVSELIEGVLKKRARHLERGIRELLGGKDQTKWAEKLYRHPLINSLFPGTYDSTKVGRRWYKWFRGRDLPSYIPRRNFALALMDIIAPGEETKSSGATGATRPKAKPDADGTENDADSSGTSALPAVTIQTFRDAVAKLENDKLKHALLPLIDGAAGDVAAARKNIEDWFDSAMDRVSGWYKRRVQVIILVIGALLTVALNADTVNIANSLSRDVSLRNALVAAAGEYAKAAPSTTAGAGDTTSEYEACKRDVGSPECKVHNNLEEIKQLGLPLGWKSNNKWTFPEKPGDRLAKVVGLLLTVLAVSLGAPFWFDVLNKIIVIRSTVKPKEKSPDEPPVDRPGR